MPVSGNTLAKYLVIVSQVIAWFTVSVMLLRRGMNQVNAVPAADDGVGNATAAASPAVAGHREPTAAKSLDNSGTPAVVAGFVMISVAAIMLIVSPAVMLMKMIEKRKRRMLDAELESPPKYEDVVESAPRYSSLFVFSNDGEMALLSENLREEKATTHLKMQST